MGTQLTLRLVTAWDRIPTDDNSVQGKAQTVSMWGNVQAGGYFDDQEIEMIDDPRCPGVTMFRLIGDFEGLFILLCDKG